ncbi:hypothetical protein ScPMuIL_005792 [Solemya velum]
MATGDTSLWLHNKLGSTDDLWSGKTICSQLSQEKLQSTVACFHTLQPHVKVKLLFSFLHIPRRNVEQWKSDLEDLLMMAIHDTDQWVSMTGEILRTYPATGMLNLDLEDNSTFADVLADLKKIAIKKSTDFTVLPMECQYLNKTALLTITGQQPQPLKHFALKRKPKSAALRAELLQKSSEAASSKKNNMPNSVPVKMRSFAKKMDDITPLKGFPARGTPIAGFRSPVSGLGRLGGSPMAVSTHGQRTGSTNLRKEGGIKLLTLDEMPVGAKEAKRRKRIAEQEAVEQQKKEKETATLVTTTSAPYTPDYAAGLVSPAPSKLSVSSVTPVTLSTPTAPYIPTGTGVLTVTPLSSATKQARENLQQQLQQQLGQSQIRTQTALPSANQSPPFLQTAQVPLSQPTLSAAPPSGQNPVKKGLSLTREQVLEAQEMFRISNKVTRPEKALILGFMAGSRENPCPQQGDILSIRLSEDEVVAQVDGLQKTMIADTFFQMNYASGEWKRFKKYRDVD